MAKRLHISRRSSKRKTNRPRRRFTATRPVLPTRTTFNLCSMQLQMSSSPIICAVAVSIRLILYSTLSVNGGKRYHEVARHSSACSKFVLISIWFERERERKGKKERTREIKWEKMRKRRAFSLSTLNRVYKERFTLFYLRLWNSRSHTETASLVW